MRIQSMLFRLIPETPLKNKIRCFLYNRNQSQIKVSYKNGIFTMVKGDISMNFHDNLFYSLQTDEDYFRKGKIEKGDTVIDAGAFWGSFTVFAALQAGRDGRVIAFEPDPESAAKLRKNIAINNLNNVTIIEKGLWSSDTTLYFQPGKDLASRFIPEEERNADTIAIPVTTIDTAMGNVPVKNKLFLKMNVEGSEMEALNGARETINKYKPYCAIRSDHFVDGRQTFDRVEQQLKDYGYTTETVPLFDITTFGVMQSAD